jgi:hypothetical protein
MSYLEPATWRAATADEVIKRHTEFKADPPRRRKPKNRNKRGLPGLLVFRSLLSPLDVYTYLSARFGEPNGLQSMMIHKIGMVREDSGNMINWDYLLKTDDKTLTITGAGREVHVMIEGEMTDEEWRQFASNLKADFKNYGEEKAALKNAMEKWYIFPNRFKALADRCADLHSELGAVVEEIQSGLPQRPRGFNKRATEDWGKTRSRLINALVASSIQLSILTPVMFESFIGLIAAVLLRPRVRRNRRLAEAFRRSSLDVKIYDLATRCSGFSRPIEETNPAMRAYWGVVNERNDIIHGNVDPVRDALEVVYFKGRTPFFPRGGDAVEGFFEALIEQYNPQRVLGNYVLAHELIAEILNHMDAPTRRSIIALMDDSQPGWDNDRGRSGILFPDYVATFHLPGTRYDTDLTDPEGA